MNKQISRLFANFLTLSVLVPYDRAIILETVTVIHWKITVLNWYSLKYYICIFCVQLILILEILKDWGGIMESSLVKHDPPDLTIETGERHKLPSGDWTRNCIWGFLTYMEVWFLARRAYATMSVSVCLSVTEVNWRIIANLGFKFRSKFIAHCHRGEGSSQQQHLALC